MLFVSASRPSNPTRQAPGNRHPRGFTLVVSITLMILLALIAIAMLGLSSIELRKSGISEARSVAMANARLGLILALGEIQRELGDDRRVTADASLYPSTKNPAAVGVWNSWFPNLASRSNLERPVRISYAPPKGQTGFRSWLVSSTDPEKTRQLAWHETDPSGNQFARLFSPAGSGFDLRGEKIPVSGGAYKGNLAWAVTQENTKARINVAADDTKRIDLNDQMQTPARPNLTLAEGINHPQGGDWLRRSAVLTSLSQASLDSAYGLSRDSARPLARDFTVDSFSLMTDVVNGGTRVDLSTGFDLSDSDFAADTWTDEAGSVRNPFRDTTIAAYQGQRPLFRPFSRDALLRVFMNFDPASVNHKFNVNGAPTFDTLRAHYRSYRHLFNSSGRGTTAFERPYSHIAMPEKVPGRPFGTRTHPSIAPILNRLNFLISIFAKSDGTLCILFTPYVAIWNPYNLEIETEGLVLYPWIDLAMFWNWSVSPAGGTTQNWNSSLSRFVGEGYNGHGRSSRPYFYLHLTENGTSVRPGTKTISPTIRLAPGEVRVFCLADTSRRELDFLGTPAARTWRMKPANSAQDLTSSRTGGIVLNMRRSIGGGNNFNYTLKTGDRINAHRVEFDRGQYHYIVGMADAHQIKNPNTELMVEARSPASGLPALPAEPNLVFYGQVHSGRAHGKGNDVINYPSFTFDEIRERPTLIGSLLTYHRTARSGAGALPHSDLMYTTNPRQPYINAYLSGAQFQSGPHYESLLQTGTTLAQLTMETTGDGRKAYYGPSHSAATGKSNLAFFEIPRSPTLSLGSFQHCDLSATAFGVATQIGNSWASPYLPVSAVSRRITNGPAPDNAPMNPGLGVYDLSYLANEALFDSFFLSGAAPEFGSRRNTAGSPAVWDADQISETKKTPELLADFFANPAANPLRNPRMKPYRGNATLSDIRTRLDGPARAVRIASHLLVEGGFNINSTSEEAWTAVLSSLRGARPASSDKTALSRFRHISTTPPLSMAENDDWSGFRTLTDDEVKTLAKNIVAEIRLRGPFLSLGEFVNRRISTDRGLNLSGALQSAIDKSGLNRSSGYSNFSTSNYPEPTNIQTPSTGVNTPGWLTQADILHSLAPTISARSDTFIIRSLGEARADNGNLLATVRLEAVVQRVPDFVDPTDDPSTPYADLKSQANLKFGRRFQVVSIREISLDKDGDPL